MGVFGDAMGREQLGAACRMIKFIALAMLLGCFSASSISAMAGARGKPAAEQVDSFVIGERFQIGCTGGFG